MLHRQLLVGGWAADGWLMLDGRWWLVDGGWWIVEGRWWPLVAAGGRWSMFPWWWIRWRVRLMAGAWWSVYGWWPMFQRNWWILHGQWLMIIDVYLMVDGWGTDWMVWMVVWLVGLWLVIGCWLMFDGRWLMIDDYLLTGLPASTGCKTDDWLTPSAPWFVVVWECMFSLYWWYHVGVLKKHPVAYIPLSYPQSIIAL